MDTCFGTWVSSSNSVQIMYVTAVTQIAKVQTRQYIRNISSLRLANICTALSFTFAPGLAQVACREDLAGMLSMQPDLNRFALLVKHTRQILCAARHVSGLIRHAIFVFDLTCYVRGSTWRKGVWEAHNNSAHTT